MRCERCHGVGKRVTRQYDRHGRPEDYWLPCRECQGSGVAHCCEGHCVPEIEREEGKEAGHDGGGMAGE